MREINAISTKRHLVFSTGTNLFLTEYKDHEQNRSTGVCGNLFTDSVRLIMPECSKAIDLWVSRMFGLYPEYGIKMMGRGN